MNWNILGRNLCDQDKEKGFPFASIEAMTWQQRKRLFQEILGKKEYDIITL